MNTLLLAAFLTVQPAPPPQALETLFRTQQRAVLRDIRVHIQADLEQRAAKFFMDEGGLQRQLQTVETGLAAR